MLKSKTMSDIIHGTIEYSGIEGEIISTPIFNRLQRISQSSLAFLTFPSNKVKRFEHSVGTMYLSGEIFYNSICNSDDRVASEFFETIVSEIKEWRSATRQTELPRELKNVKSDKILKESPYPRCPFYYSYFPANLDNKYAFPYYVAFESIRVAGLLHDVGHLPYSHILENALKNLYINAENDLHIDENVKSEFLDIMSPFVKGNDAIHEEFGKLLVNSIKQCVLDNLSHEQESDISYFFLLLVFDFAQKILCSKFTDNTVFADMHLIISGVVDSDRLDYCSRDYYCAALDKSIFNYKRFFQGYTLISKKLEGDNHTHFLFAPSVKNLLMIEELLRKRYRIYSDINYHHRVHKHEIILEKVICDLGVRELENMETIENLPNVLPLEVSSIWKLVKELKNDTMWLEYQLIQMDDSWLDTLLKHKFFEIYQETYSSVKEHGTEIQWNQFDELISTRKHYCSLIKRSSDFQLLDEEFYNMFISSDWENSTIKEKVSVFKNMKYGDFVKNNKSLFFNYCIKHITKELAIDEKKVLYYQCVEDLFNKNLPEKILNCIIRSSRFSCGLNTIKSPVFLVGDLSKEIRLEQLSFQRDSFLVEEALTPPFHFYYLPDYNEIGVPYDVDIKELINPLAKCLVDSLKISEEKS